MKPRIRRLIDLARARSAREEAELPPLTAEQRKLVRLYNRARRAWYSGNTLESALPWQFRRFEYLRNLERWDMIEEEGLVEWFTGLVSPGAPSGASSPRSSDTGQAGASARA